MVVLKALKVRFYVVITEVFLQICKKYKRNTYAVATVKQKAL